MKNRQKINLVGALFTNNPPKKFRKKPPDFYGQQFAAADKYFFTPGSNALYDLFGTGFSAHGLLVAAIHLVVSRAICSASVERYIGFYLAWADDECADAFLFCFQPQAFKITM